MKAIVCLGNIGAQYVRTPHNAGFLVGEKIAARKAIVFKQSRPLNAEIGMFTSRGSEVCVARPHTYMNLSGNAVEKIIKKFSVTLDGLLVVHDDVELALGIFKLSDHCRRAFHNGIDSIIERLHTDGFARMRVGVGPKPKTVSLKNFVLTPLDNDDYASLEDTTHKAAEACIVWARDGFTKAVNVYNRKDARGA